MISKKIEAIIVDDALQARELLRLMLNEWTPQISVVGEAENVTEAAQLIRDKKPQVIFLDIEMPGKTGLQLVEEISKEEGEYEIIFTTAYNEYAIQAFRLSAVDYLLKPIKEKQLVEAVRKIAEIIDLKNSAEKFRNLANNLKIQNNNVLCIPVNYGYDYLPVNEIEYIEADGAYSHVFLVDGTRKTISKNLKYFETSLQYISFIRKIHRSNMINIHHMRSFSKADRGSVIMKSGKELEVSRNHRAPFMDVLKELGRLPS